MSAVDFQPNQLAGEPSQGSVAPGEDQSASLPSLREDLELERGFTNRDGMPSWVLHDPAAIRYFNIGWIEFEILSRWKLASAAEIIASVNRDTTLEIISDDITALEYFLRQNGLLRLSSSEISEMRVRQKSGSAQAIANGISQNLIFKKVPLMRPQKFLQKLTPVLSPLFSPKFWLALALLFIAAIYLVSRQWSTFVHGVANMTSLEGLASIAIVMIVAKSLHELAHGIATVRYGGNVPVMGVAFIVFWPLLYTETSAAWMITDRRKRIIIASAGILAELIMAVMALSIWPFLENGPIRDAAAFSATTLILISLLFNANPLMKFDGYFVLSELLGFDNLQPRAMALLTAKLQRIFVGDSLTEPEPTLPEATLPKATRRWLLTYGIASALYRIILFGSISYAIYIFLPPIIAIPLCLSVLITTLTTPIGNFMSVTGKLAWRKKGWRGAARVALITAVLLAPFLIPIQSTIMVPVVYASGRVHHIFSPEAGIISAMSAKRGADVESGQTLLHLTSPDTELELKWALQHKRVSERLVERSLTGGKLRDGYHIRKSELSELRSKIDGLVKLKSSMQLKSGHRGRVTNVADGLRPGTWVRKREPLMEIVSHDRIELYAYAGERELELIEIAARGELWLSGRPGQNWPVRVRHIRSEAISNLDEPILADKFGGPIRVRQNQSEEMVAAEGVYKIELALDAKAKDASLPDIKIIGYVKLETPPKSLIERFGTRLIAIWRREFG